MNKGSARWGVLFMAVAMVAVWPATRVGAAEGESPNFKVTDINLGDQLFLSTRDFLAPALTGAGPEVIELTPFSATIKWLTNKDTDSTVLYGQSPGQYGQETSKAYDATTVHTITLTGLEPATTYYFQALFRDKQGNAGRSEERRLTTPRPQPALSNLRVSNIQETAATIAFNTDYFTTAVVECIDLTTLEKKTVGESGYEKSHALALTDLVSDQEYSFTITARDQDGQEIRSSSTAFRTLRDQTPPEITEVRFEPSFSTTGSQNKVRLIVSWRTNEESDSQLRYRSGIMDEGPVTSSPLDEEKVKNHVVTLSDLQQQTTYALRVVSRDASGNVSESEEFVILTPKQKRSFFQIVLDNLEKVFAPFSKAFNQGG